MLRFLLQEIRYSYVQSVLDFVPRRFYVLFTCNTQGQTERQDRSTAASGANLHGALRRPWNNREYSASKLRLAHEKELHKCPKTKKFQEYRFEDAPNYWLGRGANISRTGHGNMSR